MILPAWDTMRIFGVASGADANLSLAVQGWRPRFIDTGPKHSKIGRQWTLAHRSGWLTIISTISEYCVDLGNVTSSFKTTQSSAQQKHIRARTSPSHIPSDSCVQKSEYPNHWFLVSPICGRWIMLASHIL